MRHRVVCLTLLVCCLSIACAGVAQAHPRSSSRRHNLRSRRLRCQFFQPAPTPGEIDDLVSMTALRFEIDPLLVCAIIKVESAYNTNAVSRVGARGLMQLMPATARRFGVKNAFNPSQNVAGGTAYLKQLLHLFSGNVTLAVAAYNAGEKAVQRVGNNIPPYPETIDYVKKVNSLYVPGMIEPVTPIPVAG